MINKLKELLAILFNKRFYNVLRLFVLVALKGKNKPGSIRLEGMKITYNDAQALLGMYFEIYYKEHYRFETATAQPLIIDCGANIGLSVLYFAKKFPNATIIAIEADPKIAVILKSNLQKNGCNAEVIEKAAWSNNDSMLSFGQAGADASSIFATENVIQVPTMRFKDLLQQYPHIDMVKIDIEGAELEVISDSYKALHHADHVFVEYHSFPNQPQQLHQLLEQLSSQGFRYKIVSARKEIHPFMQHMQVQEMDVQLNVFFRKV